MFRLLVTLVWIYIDFQTNYNKRLTEVQYSRDRVTLVEYLISLRTRAITQMIDRITVNFLCCFVFVGIFLYCGYNIREKVL